MMNYRLVPKRSDLVDLVREISKGGDILTCPENFGKVDALSYFERLLGKKIVEEGKRPPDAILIFGIPPSPILVRTAPYQEVELWILDRSVD